MVRKLLVVLILATVALCCSPAMADNIHLCDVNQTTNCNAGSVISVFTGTTQAWVFGKPYTGLGLTLNIAVLTPQNGTLGNFNSNTNLSQILLGTVLQNFPNFASTASQELAATGINPGSFQVTSFAVGGWTGTNNLGQLVNLPANMTVGQIFIAYLTDSSGNLIAVTPWSSGLIFVPEPSSVMLLGAGLLALGALAGRRFLGN